MTAQEVIMAAVIIDAIDRAEKKMINIDHSYGIPSDFFFLSSCNHVG